MIDFTQGEKEVKIKNQKKKNTGEIARITSNENYDLQRVYGVRIKFNLSLNRLTPVYTIR